VSPVIRNGPFFSNGPDRRVDMAVGCNTAVHILGRSRGGVHTHEEHIHAMARRAVEARRPRVYVHASRRRDMPRRRRRTSSRRWTPCGRAPAARIASITGPLLRRWTAQPLGRVEKAYDCSSTAWPSSRAPDAASALERAYRPAETDGESRAHVPPATAVAIQDGDVVIT